MDQFTFPHAVHDSVFQWIAAIPSSTVETMERSIDKLPDSIWYNFRCRVENSVALFSVSEHQQLPDSVLVTVSTDLRRMWRLTKLVGDFRLAKTIAGILKGNGGQEMDD